MLAHGFTQTARCWGPVADIWAANHEVLAVDLPGHGESAALRADLESTGALLGATGGPATYLGYSFGARVALHLALGQPELVDALVLISGTAGIEDPVERAARREADEALAATTAPVSSFIARWTQLPLFAGIPTEALAIDERCSNTPDGLASSLRLCGTGTQTPLWDRLSTLTMPVLLLTGADDEKFTSFGRRMAEAIGPNARHHIVPGCGHTPHLQEPRLVASVAEEFLAASGGTRHQ